MIRRNKIIYFSAILLVICLLLYNNHVEKNQGVSKAGNVQPEYVNVDEFGANGEDSKDDSESIQRAINYSQKSKIGKVKLLGNRNYILRNGLVLAEGVELEFGQNTRLIIKGNFRVITVKKNASISNGILEVVDDHFNSDVIYLDGSQKFWSWDRTQIKNVTILNTSGSYKGTGLHLYAGGSDQYICFVKFTDMNIAGFHTGVKLEAKKPQDSKYSFINGNRFSNLTLDDCINGIDMNSSVTVPNESSGNEFNGLQIQVTKNTKKAIKVSGSDNKFEGIIWDIHILGDLEPIIDFSKDSTRSSLFMNVSSNNIRDYGEYNYYSSPEEEAMKR
ncbi:hypothetical protein E2K98_10190 [Bacillus salipaludis]|uniref:Glycosyl hydrolase family 28-related protein n=1 Tax=Bacillus salipaludis TaxID=2547811 RepID=A0A4R5VU19_9BACI|nr:glycosyl hydrolase family 28-related protein [Bacillus salipaludis]MDQ6600126.1 glycosyl hydrolase family 28-related protein [Bacillus salipaludis]TDK62409.1 hypothetical protein E2K98_10190 [Bacillus salipaludis]